MPDALRSKEFVRMQAAGGLFVVHAINAPGKIAPTLRDLRASTISDVRGCPGHRADTDDTPPEASYLSKFEIELMQQALSRRLSVRFLLGHPMSAHQHRRPQDAHESIFTTELCGKCKFPRLYSQEYTILTFVKLRDSKYPSRRVEYALA